MINCCRMHRRWFLAGAASTAAVIVSHAAHADFIKEIADLKPGEFTWHPDRQPRGPVAVIVSLPEQRVHVYRNGVRIAVSTCSSGKPGHETPTGVFVILEKDRHHRSSTYSDAPMPNMNRLTWSGIALHAGNLPGYPASHGCVRLPLAFSADLFGITHLGTPVIIAGKDDPFDLTHPGLVLAGYQAGRFAEIVATKGKAEHPDDWATNDTYPIVSVVASTADRRILLIENDKIVAEGPMSISGVGKLGSRVYTLQAAPNSSDMQWVDVSRSAANGALFHHNDADSLNRVRTSDDFAAAMKQRLHPGMVLVMTDLPLEAQTRSGGDFVVMSGEG